MGEVEVISGRAMTGRLKVVGPALPAELVTLTEMEVVATAVGVPVKSPPVLRLAQLGRPVALQVSGVVPVAANWNEYPVPTTPVGSGLVEVMVGATPAMVRLKEVGPADPMALVAVTARMLVPTTFGVPWSSPALLNVAHAGSPVALQLMGAVPVAAN
jgi:hypothetical protein